MEENNHEESEKEKFQLERMTLFSDAVFAIAITLLIIEVKIPEIHTEPATDEKLWDSFLEIIPKFIGFFISFFVIGLYWLSHYRMFRYLAHSNQKLVWTNLLFLLSIVIMPFSTSFLSEYYGATLRLPLAFYTVNICMSGFFSYRLWQMIGNEKNNLAKGLDKIVTRYNKIRALTTPLIFILILLISFINMRIAYIITPFLFAVSWFIKRYYYKKYPAIMKKHSG